LSWRSRKYLPSDPRDEKVIVEAAKTLVEQAKQNNIVLRILGAVAVKIHCPRFNYLHEELGRPLTDLDLIGYGSQRKEITNFLVKRGYEIDERLLDYIAMTSRLIFRDQKTNLKIDIFLDRLEMSHTINFKDRLEVDYPTISLADLLLEKLQIVKINEKDVLDIIIVTREHELAERDQETINSRYIAELLSNDWGFYFTVTQNLNKVITIMPKYSCVSSTDVSNVKQKIKKLQEIIENQPKKLKWKLRAIVGTKQKWYNDVEEILR